MELNVHYYRKILVEGIHDVITHIIFCDDLLRGTWMVAGKSSAFPIDFDGRPYDTFTLLCERVMVLCL